MVDTSALLATHERDAREAMERLHARSTLIAPEIIVFELGNVIHAKRPQAFGEDLAGRQDLVETLLLGVDLVATDTDHRRAIGKVAEENGLSFYDASFLALAMSRDAALLTEDDKLARAAAKRLGKARVIRVGRVSS